MLEGLPDFLTIEGRELVVWGRAVDASDDRVEDAGVVLPLRGDALCFILVRSCSDDRGLANLLFVFRIFGEAGFDGSDRLVMDVRGDGGRLLKPKKIDRRDPASGGVLDMFEM